MKPAISKEKFVSKYVDSKSAMLHNFVKNSDFRLRKMRAGSNLMDVVKRTTSDSNLNFEYVGMNKNVNTLEEEGPRDFFQSHEAHNSLHRLKNDEKKRDLKLSEFMENYISTGEFDERLQIEKEKNLEPYFREKLQLMSKYLGENVLREFIDRSSKSQATKSINNFQTILRLKNLIFEAKGKLQLEEEDFSPNQRFILQDGTASENSRAPYSKIHKINRDIISQLMREEHEQHLENLKHLQIQQDLQTFNDLKDHKEKKRAQTRENLSTEPNHQNFFKTALLRSSFKEVTPEQEYRQTSYRPHTTSQLKARPGTSGTPIIRVHSTPLGTENVIPNVEQIIKNLDSVRVRYPNLESQLKTQRSELEDYQSEYALRDALKSRGSPIVRQNLFTSGQSQRPKGESQTIKQSEKNNPTFETEVASEALEKYNESLHFLAIQKEFEKLSHKRPKTEENVSKFVAPYRAQTSRGERSLMFKFAEEAKKTTRTRNSPSFSPNSSFEVQVKVPTLSVKKTPKMLTNTGPKLLSKHIRAESTKLQRNSTVLPFENISSVKQFVTKRTSMNYYQRYALTKAPSDPHPGQNQLIQAVELQPTQNQVRIHTISKKNKSSVESYRQKSMQVGVVLTKPKQNATQMIAFKPSILNLEIDPKKFEYTGYKTSGKDKNSIFIPKTTRHAGWKQPEFQ